MTMHTCAGPNQQPGRAAGSQRQRPVSSRPCPRHPPCPLTPPSLTCAPSPRSPGQFDVIKNKRVGKTLTPVCTTAALSRSQASRLGMRHLLTTQGLQQGQGQAWMRVWCGG